MTEQLESWRVWRGAQYGGGRERPEPGCARPSWSKGWLPLRESMENQREACVHNTLNLTHVFSGPSPSQGFWGSDRVRRVWLKPEPIVQNVQLTEFLTRLRENCDPGLLGRRGVDVFPELSV